MEEIPTLSRTLEHHTNVKVQGKARVHHSYVGESNNERLEGMRIQI
jgi:hypothetical protein